MGIDKYKVTSGKGFKLDNYETVPGKNPIYEKKVCADILHTSTTNII